MFSILGRSTKLCDGLSRRELLRVGGMSMLGLSLADLLKAEQSPPPGIIDDPTFGRVKNIIYVWLQGGPPQHETFDPKPNAPVEVRGPFQPIQTNVPGIEFCELLPRTARIADKLAVVRSMATDNNIHSGSAYEVLTGYKYRGSNPRSIMPTDWPYFGSIIKMLKPSEKLPPLSVVWIPQIMRLNENVTPAGQTAGFLGRQWDPDRFNGDPSDPDYHVDGLRLSDIPPMRVQRRMSLLEQVQRHFDRFEHDKSIRVYDQYQAQAFDLLTSGRVQKAFAIQNEPDKLRDRYGRTKWAQCLLLARRLVEVGVRMVHVNWTREAGDQAVSNPMWDTHAQNADRVEDMLCPMFDVGFTALIDDLSERGLLDDTLVVAIGEFGRTPKINKNGGRDHWGPVFSFLLAGAGIQTGQVYGASDRSGAYPARDRVTPADLTATIMHLLGVHHGGAFRDARGREHRITTGSPIRPLLGRGVATAQRVKPGGAIARVPPYDDALLLNTDFSAPVPLHPTNRGSRPKGWRATPLLKDDESSVFGVQLLDEVETTGSRRSVAMGIRMVENRPSAKIAAKAQAMLAQEMRNPRGGRFVFTVKACGQATSAEVFEQVFLKNFSCRMVIYRYTDQSKDPARRKEFVSETFVPRFSSSETPEYQTFEISKLLDSAAPGTNFSIGNGLGVAVIVEKKTPGDLESSAGKQAFVRVESAELRFAARKINDKVTV